MTLSNFELLTNERDAFGIRKRVTAAVDVTTKTGHLWWKRETVKRRTICKVGVSWFFADTGKFTPDLVAEELARAYCAQKGIDSL